ncbi:MAG: ORF6N domain-containing protein [Candidatus Margulisiibacteriota bacterium]
MKIAQKTVEGVEKHHSEALVPAEVVENRILLIRGQKVILDKDLALLYGVKTKTLIQSVKRNLNRFPEDFMFELNNIEFDTLRSQIVTSNRGGRRYLPYAFTEHGVAMLSSVLKSERAVLVNIAIMRAFIKLRRMISRNKDIEHKLNQLEHKVERHDEDIINILNAIRQIMKEEEKPKGKFGFARD